LTVPAKPLTEPIVRSEADVPSGSTAGGENEEADKVKLPCAAAEPGKAKTAANRQTAAIPARRLEGMEPIREKPVGVQLVRLDLGFDGILDGNGSDINASDVDASGIDASDIDASDMEDSDFNMSRFRFT
jgi:hypothetical protein